MQVRFRGLIAIYSLSMVVAEYVVIAVTILRRVGNYVGALGNIKRRGRSWLRRRSHTDPIAVLSLVSSVAIRRVCGRAIHQIIE
jgi:hypothetical protein